MPAFPSLLRLKLLLLNAAMLIAEDKPESNQPRTEPRAQQPTIQTTTRNWANIPTFPTAGQTKSLPLRQKHKLAQNTAATTSTQPTTIQPIISIQRFTIRKQQRPSFLPSHRPVVCAFPSPSTTSPFRSLVRIPKNSNT